MDSILNVRSTVVAISLFLSACPVDKDKDQCDTANADTASTATCDLDGDGVSIADGDCNDDNPEIYPAWNESVYSYHEAAEEICDGADNDCDGDVDENLRGSYAPDTDGDGYGDQFAAVDDLCESDVPSGYVADATDCNDDDGTINPNAEEVCDKIDNNCDGERDNDAIDGTTRYADNDGDSFGDPNVSVITCSVELGYTENNEDCDDTNPYINPSAEEVCDTIDNDCDDEIDIDANGEDQTEVWFYDVDDDGRYGDRAASTNSCGPTGLYRSQTPGDCDDTNAQVYTGAAEVCDGVDNDCDDEIDNDPEDTVTFYADNDSDGYGDVSNLLYSCEPAPSGYTTNSEDCDDSDGSVNPSAPDIDNDGKDNNCDGTVVDSLCVTPTETTTSWKLFVTDYSVWGDSDPDWMVEGTQIGEGTGQLCGSVTLIEGHALKIQGPFNDGSFFLFGGSSSGDHYSSSTAMGISMTFENASWGTGSDGYGTVPDMH